MSVSVQFIKQSHFFFVKKIYSLYIINIISPCSVIKVYIFFGGGGRVMSLSMSDDWKYFDKINKVNVLRKL